MGQAFCSLYDRYPSLIVCREDIEKAFQILYDSFAAGGKLLTAGNGGSAADAQHIVGELMKGFVLPRRVTEKDADNLTAFCKNAEYLIANLQGALPSISLVGEPALSTAFANDQAPDLVFAQQVFGIGREGDVFLGISTSGNSKNILYAAQVAKAKKMNVIGLTGRDGGELSHLCDCCIVAPAEETYRIQEYHLPIYHAICLELENAFFGL